MSRLRFWRCFSVSVFTWNLWNCGVGSSGLYCGLAPRTSWTCARGARNSFDDLNTVD